MVAKEDADLPMSDIQQNQNIDTKLSHSAKALLMNIKKLESDQNLDLFQPDPEIEEMKMIVSTFKGGVYSAITKRLQQIISKGGVDIITSTDLMQILRDLWEQGISRLTYTEIKALEGILKYPELSLKDLSKRIGLTYSRTRRALEHLRATKILRREGYPDAAQLGLDRILIMMESCQAIPNSRYFTRMLYSDGAENNVFIKGLIPSRKREEFLHVMRTLRTVSKSTSMWILSSGGYRFSQTYYDKDQKKFELDPMHFRLLLRAGGEDLTIGSFSIGTIRFPRRFNLSEVKIIESLLKEFEMTAQDLVKDTGVSESTAFRRRSKLLRENVILPRPKIEIPSLSDRVLGIFSGDAANNIINAWSHLPISYVSQIINLEDTREKKIIFASALPTGSAADLIDILSSEMSRIDDYQVYEITAGIKQNLSVASLYDTKKKQWRFDNSFFDVRNYGICRKEASRKNIPLDLA